MRSMKEVNDVGVRALVDALGPEDARRFLAQFRATAAGAGADRKDEEEIQTLPPMTIDEAHERIRDMHDPMDQQHRL